MPITFDFVDANGSVAQHSIDEAQTLLIGRSKEADIVIDNSLASSKHAQLICNDGRLYIKDLGSTNGTLLNGQKLQAGQDYALSGKDQLAFGGIVLKMRYETEANAETLVQSPQVSAEKVAHAAAPPKTGGADASIKDVQFGSLASYMANKTSIVIGRSDGADVKLPSKDMTVSREHARVFLKGDEYFVEDLSLNGTFISGRRIPKKQPQRLKPNDTLFVGLYAFRLSEKARNLNAEMAIQANDIAKIYNTDPKTREPIGLQKMSLAIKKGQFVALMGPSGCGKSTLMKSLIGVETPTAGNIFLHGLELRSHYDMLKRKIGYVPQDDIVHRELSVEDSLYYAAKLRMADDVAEDDIQRKIDDVLNSLNINTPDLRKKLVGSLSGGQRKRVSIAVELLTDPSLLFLDEPTSPLDPETIGEFLKCIQRLAEKGTTVIMVTHKPDDLEYADKVLFLTTKGYHAFYGEKTNILTYFEAKNYIDVYSKLSKKDDVKTWYALWQSKATQLPAPEALEQDHASSKDSMIRQYWWLCRRYLNIKINDVQNLSLLLAQPIIIAGLLSFIFDKLQVGVLFLMAVAAIWFGVSNASKEIVGEIPIYKRERMFNMSIFTYLFSKITILSFIAAVQVLIFVVIVYLRFRSEEDTSPGLVYFGLYTGMMLFLAISATLLGLLISTLFDTTERVMTVVPIALMPQIMLAGVLTKIDSVFKEVVSYFMLGRWGTEIFCNIQDSYQGFKKTVYVYRMPDTPKGPGLYERGEQKEITESIYTQTPNVSKELFAHPEGLELPEAKIPKMEGDTIQLYQDSDTLMEPQMEQGMKYVKDSALDLIGFYEQKDKLLAVCDGMGLQGPVMMVMGLNFIVFVATFIFLKRKDSI